MSQWPRFLLAALVLGLVLAFVATRPAARGHLEAFVSYYCGGAAVGAHVDPYATAFVAHCEEVNEPGLMPAGVAEPAVLPPAGLAFFALFALLPYQVAGGLFLALSLGALLGAAVSVARVTGLRSAVPFGAFAFLCGFVNLYYGEIVPIVLFGLCFAGWALSRKRYALAAAGLAIALAEPHVAIPAALAAFAYERRTRLPLAVVAGVLLCASFVLGPHSLWHFVHDVLPVHAWAEISSGDQYSSTWIAHWLGAGNRMALDIGSAFSLLGWVAGVVVAQRVAARLSEPAALVYVPVAFAVVLPLFVHDLQLPLAIPAGLLLARRGRHAGLAWAGVVLSAFPWVPAHLWKPTYPLLVLAAVALAFGAIASLRYRLVFAASLIAGYTALEKLLARAKGIVASSGAADPVPTGADPSLASVAWGRYVWAAVPSREITVGTLCGKLLSFAGPFAVAGAALLEASGPLPYCGADGSPIVADSVPIAAADGVPIAAAD